jgi:nucleoid-associated protein YgaU
MQRKASTRTRIALLFMGFLVILPFLAVFLAAVPASQQNAASQPTASARAHVTPHASKPATPTQSQPSAHPKLHTRVIQHVRNKTAAYVVKAGDTLWAIAIHLHVKGGWPALYHANAHTVGSNPNLIFPGQHLTINQTE